jgi:hypothetical protein
MTAEYRSVQTRMWREDEWFQSLDTDARLLFIYLFTNPSASIAGIYRLPLRTIEFESGLDKARITELLAQFSAANKAHYADGVVWVVRMRENQIPGAISPKVQVRLDKDIAAIPHCPLKIRYLKHYGYPIDTVSILDRTDTDTDTVTETTNVAACAVPAALPFALPPVDATEHEPIADNYKHRLEQLKSPGANKAAILMGIYKDCFGGAELPDYGYLAKTAKQVGGAGRLAQLMFERVTNPPTGDILAHIIASENTRKKRAAQTGGNREISEVTFAANGADIYG